MRISSISLLIIPLLLVPTLAFGADWYDSNWQKARSIDLDSADFASTLTDYPLYVNITSIDLGVDTQADCDDIVFTHHANETKLSHEIENCDTTNDILEAWVKVPNAYSNGTEIMLYYDNSGATDQQDTQNTWNSNFKMVWHLNGTFVDSTSNRVDGTNSGTTAQTDEYIGDSRHWDAVNDIITADDSNIDLLWDSGGTITMWINPNSDGEGSTGRLITTGGTTSDEEYLWFLRDNGSGARLEFWHEFNNNNFGKWDTDNHAATLNEWSYVVITYDSGSTANDPTFYVNGAVEAHTETNTPTGTRDNDSGEDKAFGNHQALSRTFDGEIDDIRMYNGILSANWVSSDYECQRDDGSCITVGAEGTEPAGGGSVAVTDNMGISESLNTVGGEVSVTDNFGISESTVITGAGGSVAITDDFGISESVVASGPAKVFLTDNFGAQDSNNAVGVVTTFNAIKIYLNTPTATRLGGVFAESCDPGDYVSGIDTAGHIICTTLPP